MEVLKEGIEQVFTGKARCKQCGCEFTYEDSDVFSEKTGYSHTGMAHNGMYVGDSNIKSAFYVICPHCQCYVKAESIKQRKSSKLGLGIFVSIFVALIIVMLVMLAPKHGITCANCGERTTILSEYDQYQCPYYNCNEPGKHITYHCEHCGESYHIIEKE